MRSVSLALGLAIAAAPALAAAADAPPGDVIVDMRLRYESVRAALFDGARPGFADRHKVWLTLEAKY